MIDTSKQSYYTVGDRVFLSKTQALIEATKTGHYPTWTFHNDVFSKVNWTNSFGGDLTQIYQARARQIREKYDYVILSYSGGSDSWTILDAFLSAGIKIDEVMYRAARKFTEKLYVPNKSIDALNIHSEWDYNIKPDLEFLRDNHPEIKITIYDWSDDLQRELVEDDWYGVNDHMNPGVFRKYSVVTETEQKMIDSGKKSCIIIGVDKPQIVVKNNQVYFYFLDKLANNRSIDHNQVRTTELFFWTPDMPEIVQAQSNTIYQHLVQYQHTITDYDNYTRGHAWRDLIRDLVYPRWDSTKFQVKKPSSNVWCEYDGWMFGKEFQDHRYYQSWQHGLNSIKNVVDKKYHQQSWRSKQQGQKKFDGWVGFVSPMYYLGSLT